MAESKMMKGTSTVNDTGASGTRSKVVVILGAQWGDEGKGRMVDLLCRNADIVCRCQVCNVSSLFSWREGCRLLAVEPQADFFFIYGWFIKIYGCFSAKPENFGEGIFRLKI